MRDDFERFGGHASVCTTKRGINNWLWPCVAIVMHDEMRKVRLSCEGLMIGEKEEACDFVCEFLIGLSPSRDVVHARVVAGD